jgi:hypothetical protein
VAASCRHLACMGGTVRVDMAEIPRETPRRRRPGELHRRRVVLLAESAGLAGVLGHLLGPADRLSRVGSLRELAGSRSLDTADVVVLDLPDEDRAAAVGQVRRHYQGPLVVLAGEGARAARPLADDACTLLTRPFSVDDLAAALSVPGRTLAAAPSPAGGVVPAVPAAPAAAPRRLDRLADRAVALLVALVEGWQTRRQVRVAGFAALAVVAFAVAFALAAHGRCGPGCDPLGAGLSPAPTIASVGSRAPSPTGARHPASTTIIRAGTPGTGAFLGSSGRRRASTTSERSAPSSTTRRPVTTRPATTRPASTPSTAPPTTAPPTTQPPTTPPPTTAAEAPAPAPTLSGRRPPTTNAAGR